MFLRSNDTMKGKSYVFSGFKQKNNLILLCFKIKLKQNSCD